MGNMFCIDTSGYSELRLYQLCANRYFKNIKNEYSRKWNTIVAMKDFRVTKLYYKEHPLVGFTLYRKEDGEQYFWSGQFQEVLESLIKPLNCEFLKDICSVLNYSYTSDIAYIGKAGFTKSSDLRSRAKQEMGWSNFEGATFVRKIGLYLGFDVKDKKNKVLREKTKEFICSNFSIECKVFETDNLQSIEIEYIQKLKPCMNVKKVIKST